MARALSVAGCDSRILRFGPESLVVAGCPTAGRQRQDGAAQRGANDYHRRMERLIESLLLGTRWLLLPLYVALIGSVLAIYVMVGREMMHLIGTILTIGESELVLILLAVLDLCLVANLLVMVAISSYESFISRIDAAHATAKPEWLGKMDSNNVKLKVSLSIVMISAIHLLRAFMMETTTERMLVMAGVHMVFVFSAVLLALIDRMQRKS